jgi:hypothetical protein
MDGACLRHALKSISAVFVVATLFTFEFFGDAIAKGNLFKYRRHHQRETTAHDAPPRGQMLRRLHTFCWVEITQPITLKPDAR